MAEQLLPFAADCSFLRGGEASRRQLCGGEPSRTAARTKECSFLRGDDDSFADGGSN
ncbi:glycogen/starch/alpha-glucan phosphorylase [Sesbania bispinosa]|nr:glycogen/starch/alpha-glucan phosphorylase [Sesbania bispinosa]